MKTPMNFREHLLRLFTLDPLHIGVGQDSMGEVDLPIDREEETGVPRIPGTSLKGGFRGHAAWKLQMKGEKDKPCPGEQPAAQDAAALGLEEKAWDRDDFCSLDKCPLCQAFGRPSLKLKNGDDIQGREGKIWFRDARLAFFPALTNRGTLWFSTPGRAAAWLGLASREELTLAGLDPLALAVSSKMDRLVVGWLEIKEINTGSNNPEVEEVLTKLQNNSPAFPNEKYWSYIAGHTVLLDENNFYRVVETCLERRTCNRVDPETGAVKSGALFSYEALPRNTLLCGRLFMDSGSFTPSGGAASLESVCNLAAEGLARMGIGGLQTRGLGSILMEPLPEPDDADQGGEK